jgi:hypothetical protein
MQNPEPPKPATNWTPHQSVVGGSIFGTALAQIVVAVCDQYFAHPLSAELASAVTTVCVTLCVYFIPDKSRS